MARELERKVGIRIYFADGAQPLATLGQREYTKDFCVMIKIEAFRILGSIFPAVFGGGFLFLGYTSIMLLSEKEKYSKFFGVIWSACSTGWAYIVEDNRLSHFLYFRYALSDQIISFELWYILVPAVIFILFRLIQKSRLKYIVTETSIIVIVLNFAYFVGIFSVAIALAVVDLIF